MELNQCFFSKIFPGKSARYRLKVNHVSKFKAIFWSVHIVAITPLTITRLITLKSFLLYFLVFQKINSVIMKNFKKYAHRFVQFDCTFNKRLSNIFWKPYCFFIIERKCYIKCCWPLIFTIFTMDGSGQWCSITSIMPVLLYSAALISGVLPTPSWILTSAPLSSNTLAMSMRLYLAAQMRAVWLFL